MVRLLLVAMNLMILALMSGVAQHYHSPDFHAREIKALSNDQIEGYLEGKGMGMALAAELNSYPGPKHVLELSDSLKTTVQQKQEVEQIFNEMHEEAVRLGNLIVEKEKQLDRLFASGEITEDTLESLSNEIAILQGKLRFAHLNAHLRTRAVLTPLQIAAYNYFRGYGEAPLHYHHEHRKTN